MSDNNFEQEKRLARLLANTLTRKRPHSIIVVVEDIIWLKNKLSSLKAVSERIGISTEMLTRFMNVKKLCPEVQKLVKNRNIDSVEIVNPLTFFDFDSQLVIAKNVVNGHLTSSDLKVLRSYKKNLPNLGVTQLIERVLNSKDKKVYVLNFYIPPIVKPKNVLLKFQNLIGKNEIISFESKRQIGKIKVTKIGLKTIREHSKKKNLNLRKYIQKYIIDLIIE